MSWNCRRAFRSWSACFTFARAITQRLTRHQRLELLVPLDGPLSERMGDHVVELQPRASKSCRSPMLSSSPCPTASLAKRLMRSFQCSSPALSSSRWTPPPHTRENCRRDRTSVTSFRTRVIQASSTVSRPRPRSTTSSAPGHCLRALAGAGGALRPRRKGRARLLRAGHVLASVHGRADGHS